MLTKQDLKQIEDIVDSKLDEKLDEKLEEKFEEKLKFLPSKDEFYESMDQIMGELKAIRESQDILTGKSSDHEERLERLEEIHPQNTHQMLAKAM